MIKKINVVVFGHGSLAIWLSKYIKNSKKYKLQNVIVSNSESIFDLSLKNWCLNNKINMSQNISALKNKNYDLGISIYYDKIIRSNINDKFKNIINLHNSLLPEFRGVNPINWAFKLKRPIGVTLHRIENKIDGGLIISSKKIIPKNSVFEAHLECQKKGIFLLKKFLRDYPKIKYFDIKFSKKYYSLKKSSQLGIYRNINQKKTTYKIYGNFLLNNFQKKSSLFIFSDNLPKDFDNDYKKKYHILLISDKNIKINKNCVVRDKIKNFDNIYLKLIQNKIYFNKINIQPDLMKKYNLYKFQNLKLKNNMKTKNYTIKDLIKFYFKKKVSIVDAGVHKGLFLTKKIGLKNINKALMIDPIKNESLKKLIDKKFRYLNVALSNKRKETSFFIHSYKYPEWSSLHQISNSSPYKTIYKKSLIKPLKKIILQESLDNILSKNSDIRNYFNLNKDKIDILKIDCQSNTLEILQGTHQILKKKKFRMIVAAINPYEFYKNKTDDFVKILKYLNDINYELINISNAHSGKLGSLNYSFSDFKIWTFDAIFINRKNFK